MDTVIWPSGSQGYDVLPVGSRVAIGHIWMKGSGARIEAVDGSPLVGIDPGPYLSRDEAMRVIERHTGGACVMGGFREQ
jgi:hypothetical protein